MKHDLRHLLTEVPHHWGQGGCNTGRPQGINTRGSSTRRQHVSLDLTVTASVAGGDQPREHPGGRLTASWKEFIEEGRGDLCGSWGRPDVGSLCQSRHPRSREGWLDKVAAGNMGDIVLGGKPTTTTLAPEQCLAHRRLRRHF